MSLQPRSCLARAVSCVGVRAFLNLPGSLPGAAWPPLAGLLGVVRLFAFGPEATALDRRRAGLLGDPLWVATTGPVASAEDALRARISSMCTSSPKAAEVCRPLLCHVL